MGVTVSTRPAVALVVDPPSHHFLGDLLFDSRRVPLGGDDILAPYVRVREHFTSMGIPVHTVDRLGESPLADRHVYVSMGMLESFRRIACRSDTWLAAFFAMECPIVEPSLYRALPGVQESFHRLFSWSDSESLLPFTGRPVRCEPLRWPQSFDRVHEDAWRRRDRKFLVMINANKLPRVDSGELYRERLRAIAFFEARGEIDLYGPEWDEAPFRVGRTRVPWTARRAWRGAWKAWQRVRPDPLYAAARRAWRGRAKSKRETLSGYTWALCFENMVLKGWITEKIFDCFFAGTIPVYLGAPDISEAVPPECFVDARRFESYADLREHLRGLSEPEREGYREAARDFIASPRFDPFRKEAFLNLFRRIVTEETGAEV